MNRQVDPLISDLPRLVFDSAVERPVFVGQAVIVVKCDQGPNFELYSGSFAFIPIVDDSGVLSLHHEQRFLNLDSVYAERENWEWSKPELLEIVKAVWMYRAGVTVCAKFISSPVDDQRFF